MLKSIRFVTYVIFAHINVEINSLMWFIKVVSFNQLLKFYALCFKF